MLEQGEMDCLCGMIRIGIEIWPTFFWACTYFLTFSWFSLVVGTKLGF